MSEARLGYGVQGVMPGTAWRMGRVWARLTEMRRAHASRRDLAEMNDRMLADIGLTPGDAAVEAGRAMWDLSPPGARR